MDEFIEQFIVEARELIGQASEDLIALGAEPGQLARLDSAFRAFHTLKGAAGIVEFLAMARLMHTAEDTLSRMRPPAEATREDLDFCLACLDQTSAWLDIMETTGAAPANAEAEAETLARHVERKASTYSTDPLLRQTDGDEEDGSVEDWCAALLDAHGDSVDAARVALRMEPDRDCFFRGTDPIAMLAELPGLLALEVSPSKPWPALATLDVYGCNLIFKALSSASVDEVTTALAKAGGRLEVRPLGERPAPLSQHARAMLAAQRELLVEAGHDATHGRRNSALRAAANVLRHAGRATQAARLESTSVTTPDAIEQALALIDEALGHDGETVSQPVQRPPAGARESSAHAAQTSARTLRVDAARVDALVALAGEFAIAKNALALSADLAEEGGEPQRLARLLREQHANVERLVRDLQSAVMQLRVLPMRHVFQRFPRRVREIAAALGKPVRFVMDGEATEADKTVVEALFEPLLHVLRNALDHGVEPPDERVRAGKDRTATIALRAARRGNHVSVEVRDDGRGVDVARVRAVAAEKGVATSEALSAMTDAQVVDLIFAPGFSTATRVTDVSGRGVGMDAVRNAALSLGGRVEIDSVAGEGAVVRFTLPFSIMITRVMIVEAGGQAFGLPFDRLLETVRVARLDIAPLGGERAFSLRDKTIPLLQLAALLGHPQASDDAEACVVIAAFGEHVVGLEVDKVCERMDLVLKPAHGLLACVPGVAGATLLGDGRVLIVLDLEELLS